MTGVQTQADAGAGAGTLREIVAAQGDPLRSRLIVTLATAGPLGAAELADRVGEPAQKVRRHLNVLCGQGFAKVCQEVRRRGVVKRLYVLEGEFLIDEADDEQLSDADRRRSTLGLLRLIFEEAGRAATNPRLAARSDRVVANLPTKVDERGWCELSELHHETLERAKEIVARSGRRLENDPGGAIGVVSQQILLEVPEHAESADPL